MPDQIKIIDDPLYQLLRAEQIADFNTQKQNTATLPDFSFCDFRGLDLRGMHAEGLNFSNAYFRGADLRGIDFRQCTLEGASIAGTKISGCYFPEALSADEIVMSLNHGTRMRYKG
ncbi:MAG: pentapeptide repeat-containing protein [Pseudomonadales bacterium]|nr:pentapeptide repeat-containing protein [Pseudomonadales bacterium]